MASHLWPSMHFQHDGVRESMYRGERHWPPRRLARLRISERVDLRTAEMTATHQVEDAGEERLTIKQPKREAFVPVLIVRSGNPTRLFPFVGLRSGCR
jgi:hypothetical protein